MNGMSLIQVNTGLQQYTNPSAIAAAEQVKAEIQMGYWMAFQFPRDEETARLKILHECERPSFADKVEYEIKYGNEYVHGPTIRLAEVIFKYWKNLRENSKITFEDDKIRRVSVSVIDLETNGSYNDEVEVSKFIEKKYNRNKEAISERKNSNGEMVYLVPATQDEFSRETEKAKSKTLRKCILRLVPQDLIDQCLLKARNTLIAADKEDPDGKRREMIAAFAKIGIMPDKLSKLLGHDTSFIKEEELLRMRKIYRALEEGAKWTDYVPEEGEAKPEPVKPATKEKTDKKDELQTLKNSFLAKMREAGMDPKTQSVDFIKNNIGKDPKKTSCTAEEYSQLIKILENIIANNTQNITTVTENVTKTVEKQPETTQNPSVSEQKPAEISENQPKKMSIEQCNILKETLAKINIDTQDDKKFNEFYEAATRKKRNGAISEDDFNVLMESAEEILSFRK